ncbi:MAG: hypothetical protein CME40_04960 [Haliea sp.]|nr:hypothetical protein [Haliea sp.]
MTGHASPRRPPRVCLRRVRPGAAAVGALRSPLCLLAVLLVLLVPQGWGQQAEDPIRARVEQLREEAVAHRNRGEIAQARALLRDMEGLLNDLQAPLLQARYWHVLGTLDAEEGHYARALEHFHRAYLQFQAQEETWGILALGNAIGAVHQMSGNHHQAREYLENTLALARREENLAWQVTALGNLAISVAELEGPAAARPLEEQALGLARELGAPNELAIRLANTCRVQEAAGALDKAQATCREAAAHLEPLGLPRFLAGTRMVQGDLQRRLGSLQEAESHYLASLALGRDIPSVEPQLRERLGRLYRELGDDRAAAEQLDRAATLRETQAVRERADLMQEAESGFVLRLAENEIAALQRESSWQAEQLRWRRWINIATFVALCVLVLLTMLIYRAYRQRVELQQALAARNSELEQALETIRELAARDPLTGLFNRRAFREVAQHAMVQCRRRGQPMAVVLADIDHFKALNDSHGHAVGDEVLCAISRRLEGALRESDLLCRWGGEEFVILFCDASLREALRVTTRVREALLAAPVDTAAGQLTATMTFGIARLESDFDSALAAADKALYLGKQSGRDRIECSAGAPHPADTLRQTSARETS